MWFYIDMFKVCVTHAKASSTWNIMYIWMYLYIYIQFVSPSSSKRKQYGLKFFGSMRDRAYWCWVLFGVNTCVYYMMRRCECMSVCVGLRQTEKYCMYGCEWATVSVLNDKPTIQSVAYIVRIFQANSSKSTCCHWTRISFFRWIPTFFLYTRNFTWTHIYTHYPF